MLCVVCVCSFSGETFRSSLRQSFEFNFSNYLPFLVQPIFSPNLSIYIYIYMCVCVCVY